MSGPGGGPYSPNAASTFYTEVLRGLKCVFTAPDRDPAGLRSQEQHHYCCYQQGLTSPVVSSNHGGQGVNNSLDKPSASRSVASCTNGYLLFKENKQPRQSIYIPATTPQRCKSWRKHILNFNQAACPASLLALT